jgi:hypothetical protein
MTKEEFDDLKQGDVIESNKSKARYVILDPKVPIDPIVQLRKEHLQFDEAFQHYKIIAKVNK